jgi:two-component system response regulator RegX3
VDVVENGSEVVQRENLNDYDLFILDVKMPGIGGAALYDHIASVSKELSSRVMFITGDTTNPGTKEFIDSTSSPLLTKPFTIENLMSRVNRFTSTWSPAHSEDSE